MQVLQTPDPQSDGRGTEEIAAHLMELVPELMYFLRTSYRKLRPSHLTIPQIRLLVFVQRRPAGSISQLADMLGVSLPAVSRLVETMVRKKLVRRVIDKRDRRNAMLTLTAEGQQQLDAAQASGREALSQRLSKLPEGQRRETAAALAGLRSVFGD
jgi:DNA-binding MarR family transcriptional regulator